MERTMKGSRRGSDGLDAGFVSADSHVNEPRALWTANLPASLVEHGMRGIEGGDDGAWKLVFEGQHVHQESMGDEQERLAALDPARRTEIMLSDGVVAECIFPTIGLYVWMIKDPVGGTASCRIYNDWIFDQLQRHSERFCCAGLIPTWSVDGAVSEVEHVSSLGLRALMLPAVAPRPWNDSCWEPLWDAIEATRLPVVMHQGTGHDIARFRGAGATVANMVAIQTIAPSTAALLATSGVLHRHPSLHVVFVEFNTGWLAWMMETTDFYDEAFRGYDRFTVRPSGRPYVHPDLPEVPSHYLNRQIHATFQRDLVGMRNATTDTVGQLLWGSDYPHEEGTYPHSRAVVAEQAAMVHGDDAVRIFRENAIEVFGFDRAALTLPGR